MIPERLLLSIYLENRVRLAKCTFPVGVTLTRWINEAISQKIDRDSAAVPAPAQPPAEPLAKSPIDPMAILAATRRAARGVDYVGPYSIYYQKANPVIYSSAVLQHKARRDASPGIEALIEEMCSQEPKYVLSEEHKRKIMEEHHRVKQKIEDEKDPDAIPDEVKGHPRLYAKWRAEQDEKIAARKALAARQEELERPYVTAEMAAITTPVKVAKLAEDEEIDFWGDEAFEKVRANVKKHLR